ncbi:hypothetical protein WBG78_00210 [Chryseolinea sp. T2]|uniref:hypothetical protein n=1 Tax=Chryseolinea sp. T2 TaxID=3129255 RepID=UPI0030786189
MAFLVVMNFTSLGQEDCPESLLSITGDKLNVFTTLATIIVDGEIPEQISHSLKSRFLLELWMGGSIPDYHLHSGSSMLFRRRRKQRGGSVNDR